MADRYFMARPKPISPNGMRCLPGYFYVRFYSRDEYPWYQAGAVIKLPAERAELKQLFQEFIDSAEVHRNK